MEVSRILFFLVPPQVLARFSRKILPEPEVPKNQSLEVKILPKPEETKKKAKFRRSWAWRSQDFFVVPPQVLARFSRKILPEPEEVPKNQSLEVNILPKPEEIQKKKSKFQKSWGLETS